MPKIMFFLTLGYLTNSMALVADSFHMLSDIAALVIAFLSVRMAPKSWSKNTFGWARAEVKKNKNMHMPTSCKSFVLKNEIGDNKRWIAIRSCIDYRKDPYSITLSHVEMCFQPGVCSNLLKGKGKGLRHKHVANDSVDLSKPMKSCKSFFKLW